MENETIVIGGPAGIAALVSGDVDYSGAGGSGLRAAVKGAPLKAIMYQTEKPTWYLIVHPSITQPSDLRGKKIGVALIGDSEDRFTTLFVERAGLSAKDVTKISVGTNPGDKILALKSGGISAVVLDPAATVMAEREGLRSLAYLGDIFPLPFQGYVTTDRKISENSRTGQKMDQGYGQVPHVFAGAARGSHRSGTEKVALQKYYPTHVDGCDQGLCSCISTRHSRHAFAGRSQKYTGIRG